MFENPLTNCIIVGVVIWAVIILVSLLAVAICIHRAPYGKEDDDGFHVIFPEQQHGRTWRAMHRRVREGWTGERFTR